jgi:hypothetical protein
MSKRKSNGNSRNGCNGAQISSIESSPNEKRFEPFNNMPSVCSKYRFFEV